MQQLTLRYFRELFSGDCEHDPRVAEFIRKTEGIDGDAIVQMFQAEGSTDIELSLLVDCDGRLLAFA